MRQIKKLKPKAVVSVLFQVDGKVICSKGASELRVISAAVDKYVYRLLFDKPFMDDKYKIQPPLFGIMRCNVSFDEKRRASVIIKLFPQDGTNLVSCDKIPIEIF